MWLMGSTKLPANLVWSAALSQVFILQRRLIGLAASVPSGQPANHTPLNQAPGMYGCGGGYGGGGGGGGGGGRPPPALQTPLCASSPPRVPSS